jgi:hypothetical protein
MSRALCSYILPYMTTSVIYATLGKLMERHHSGSRTVLLFVWHDNTDSHLSDFRLPLDYDISPVIWPGGTRRRNKTWGFLVVSLPDAGPA